jgi:hypothetical protein
LLDSARAALHVRRAPVAVTSQWLHHGVTLDL